MNRIANALRIEQIARILYPAVLALVVYATLWIASVFDEPPGLTPAAILIFMACVMVLNEAIRWYSRRLDRRWPWRDRSGTRLSLQIGGSVVIAVIFSLLVYIPLKLHEIEQGARDVIAWPHLATTAVVAVVFALALNALSITLDFYLSWQQVQHDATRMEELVLRAELDALKTQVNPHFLFNSLNTVHGLIAQDPPAARALVLELSDVLRYALSHGHRDLVPLAQELAFLDAYRHLLETRHGRGLRIDIEAMHDDAPAQLPPMSLQLLVENAVRHNRTCDEDPLVVHLSRCDDTVVVSNPIKPRHGANPGTGTGLSNIDQRYRLLGADGVRISNDGDVFSVAIGLLPCTR